MSFLTAELMEKKQKWEKNEGSFSQSDSRVLKENLESLDPRNHVYSDEKGVCFYCGESMMRHKNKVVITGAGVREIHKV